MQLAPGILLQSQTLAWGKTTQVHFLDLSYNADEYMRQPNLELKAITSPKLWS